MRTAISAGLVVSSFAAGVDAQQAVQWKVSDGGNGHWYQVAVIPHGTTWHEARNLAAARGGHLVTITSGGEASTVRSVVGTSGPWFVASPAWDSYSGPWLGGYQDDGGAWHWITGEPWSFTAWCANQPSGNACAEAERFLHVKVGGYCDETRWWGDLTATGNCIPELSGLTGMLVEFDADCNNDGIVDFGQILQGQLTDLNTDGVPDICQQPTCVDADLFRDFNVNGTDLGILLSQWGPNTSLTFSDINKDGAVNGADLGILLSFWGPCP